MSIGIDIYNGLYETEEFRGTIANENGSSCECICQGITTEASDSDLGRVILQNGTIRVLTDNEFDGITYGTKLTFTDYRSVVYTVEVMTISRKSGVSAFGVKAVNQ